MLVKGATGDDMQNKRFLYYWHLLRGMHRSPVFPLQKVTIVVFFDVSLNKVFNKQLSCWWFQGRSVTSL